ncbi:hypothetical protein RhiJN_14873 [Ceratobasidium sp. AG-Ba]|nr:hypothetical protein RhiJN_14873 [Ceratobasidium sp. AG-Ba]QRW15411.1 hypothetical protein RhiLY_14410 [Ceratobasidium sp. AG-Ba]
MLDLTGSHFLTATIPPPHPVSTPTLSEALANSGCEAPRDGQGLACGPWPDLTDRAAHGDEARTRRGDAGRPLTVTARSRTTTPWLYPAISQPRPKQQPPARVTTRRDRTFGRTPFAHASVVERPEPNVRWVYGAWPAAHQTSTVRTTRPADSGARPTIDDQLPPLRPTTSAPHRCPPPPTRDRRARSATTERRPAPQSSSPPPPPIPTLDGAAKEVWQPRPTDGHCALAGAHPPPTPPSPSLTTNGGSDT